MLWKDVKLEKRDDEEKPFDANNKTDRKIVFTVVLVSIVLIALIVGLFILYFTFFKGKA